MGYDEIIQLIGIGCTEKISIVSWIEHESSRGMVGDDDLLDPWVRLNLIKSLLQVAQVVQIDVLIVVHCRLDQGLEFW